MGALREILAVFDIDTSGLEKAGKKSDGIVSGFKDSVAKAGAAIGGGLLVSGLKDMVTGLVEQGSALNDASAQLGINVEDLQAWQFAAKLNGVEAGELSASLTKLQKSMVDNAKGGAESGGQFQKLGVALRDSKGNIRDTTEVLYDTGLAIARLPKGAEQTAAAMEVFGKAGKKLLPMFAEGEAGLKNYLSEVRRLGGGITGDAVGKLDDLGDNMDRFDMAMTAAKSKLVVSFLPGITQMVTSLTNGAAAIAGSESAMSKVKVGIEALGMAGAVAGLRFMAPWLPAIAGFTLLGLLVQDFVVGLNGGESEIGDIIDQLFGEGKGKSFFAEVKKDVQALIEDIKQLAQDIRDLKSGKTINDLGDVSYNAEKTGRERARAGATSGYLSKNEQGMYGGLADNQKELLGFAKEAIVASNEAHWGQWRTLAQQNGPHAVEDVDNQDAFRLVDAMKDAGIDKIPQTQSDFWDAFQKATSSTKEVPGPAPRGDQNVTANITNNITNNVTSSDENLARDVGSATAGEAARSTYEGVKRAVPAQR